jgi:hypothetical protein
MLISAYDFSYEYFFKNKKYRKYRIYSNFDIFYKGKKINSRIKKFSDLRKIRFSRIPGVIVLDELGINANSKDSHSEGNRLISETNFLARKKNCSTIFISQRFMSIPIDQREMADLILRVKKTKKQDGVPIFSIIREYRLSAQKKIDIGKWQRSMIQSMQKNKLSYDQLDTSIIK